MRLLLKDQESGKVTFTTQPKEDDDLASEHERYLTDVVYQAPLFVSAQRCTGKFILPIGHVLSEARQGLLHAHPSEVRNHVRANAPWWEVMCLHERTRDDKHVDCFDLLVPNIGEIIGGSMRIDDADTLVKRMDELNMDAKALDWYVDLRRHGTRPNGGAGLGFERLVQVFRFAHARFHFVRPVDHTNQDHQRLRSILPDNRRL